MASKAKRKSSTGGEAWFNDAVKEMADDHCGSAAVAEELLVKGLKAGLPWSHMLPDGTRVAGDDGFWKSPFLTVDRAENRASIGAPIAPVTPDSSDVPARVFSIKVLRAAALALVSAAPVSNTSAKALIEDEVKRMKRTGEIPEGILKTHLAKALAAKVGVSPKYISNNLKVWGLWPVSNIK